MTGDPFIDVCLAIGLTMAIALIILICVRG